VLHVGLDLSRRRVDVCLISSGGELVEHFRAPADRDGLYGLTRRVAVYGEPVRGVVESMNGARFVRDELVRCGWEVLVADAQRVKGLAPLACKTGKVDARVLAELSFPGSGAGDLAGEPGAARRAGALAVAAALGQAPLDPQEPGVCVADRVRPSGPDGGPVRRRRPPAARRPGFPRAVAFSCPGER
jgi:hypothetical protein